MRTTVKWSEMPSGGDGESPPIYSLCYSPTADNIMVASGVRVLIYDASMGSVLRSLKGHTDTVYCVACSHDGKSLASGGADKTVILWNNKWEGVLKYQHKESVQALAYNPSTGQLVSVASSDYGVWSPDQAKVGKNTLPSKGLCAAWSRDGESLAIGLFDGTVLLISPSASERVVIKRTAPVWTLAFSPITENGLDVLVVGSWDRRLSFYNTQGNSISKEKELPCDPCCISFYGKGSFLLVSGSDHKVTLYTKDGNMLVNVVNANDWIWSVHQRPGSPQVCCGTNDGNLSAIEIAVPTVHSIYHDQYVYRDKMTDIVVHQLTLERKIRIPCNDYVRKLAMYRDRLAVQLQDRIVVFELYYDDERQLRFQDIAHVGKKLECNLLCVTFNAVLVCFERRLTMYDFQGNKRREWAFETPVRYIRVVGGAEGKEVLLVGLKNGAALRVSIDNPFPTTLVKINSPIRCLDVSCMRGKLAVVDENELLQVFDLRKENEVLFTETGVLAVACNTEYDDMISYTTSVNMLNIKTGSLPPYQQKIPGFVVGFKANRVFNLNSTVIDVVEVPHSHALYRYVEKKDFDSAYRIACLGVTEGDWKMLGMHAMTQLRLDIARRAFIRIHEVKFVELLNRLELERRQGTAKENSENDALLMGDIMAYQGRYQEAARYFLRAGQENKAIEMFCDLKMWKEAKKICSNEKYLKELIFQQARWAEDSQNYIEAASLYQACGDAGKAIAMTRLAGQLDKLMEMCRALPRSEVALITECAEYFRKHDAKQYALEAYERVGDIRSVIALHVGVQEWREAFAFLERYPSYIREVYVPWATWLAENGKFEEALEAYRLAKWPREAVRVTEALAANSVVCRKFRDAAFYYMHLAREWGVLEDGQQLTEAQWAKRMQLSAECVRRADIYYAYHFVYTYATQPFPYDEVVLFNLSKYVVSVLSGAVVPLNVGKGEVLYTLARVANQLNMTRISRVALELLQAVVLPIKVTEQVDVDSLLIRSKAYTDREDLQDVCFRCKQAVPQLTNPGDRCPNCAHPFVRSFVNFHALPLVEFTLSNELGDAEAERIILAGSGRKAAEANNENGYRNDSGWKADTGADVITFAEEEDNIDAMIDQQMTAMGRASATGRDPFQAQLAYVTRPGRPNAEYQPFVANAEMLRRMRRDEVFIVKAGFGTLPMQNKYYRVMNRSVGIVLCPGCQHFFTEDEYEYECMKGSGCPLCRHRMGRQTQRSVKRMLYDILDSEK
ncbi:intraflagellar transport 122-like protein [Trypanosoma conorhini]|uniref:Intraflagellar transport protein 122 homolog n=1 Tax=Trypanosoma conorhini TaxID=83891 RepID=A0A3R7L0K6_9TRYP|nr:intraflagellar transport 122-like protein [Trypanosoma conorhini]RNF17244.1 intraflagellar transport 122-like protein [Trypanosoma conorhini]